jgi:O-antigen ligase
VTSRRFAVRPLSIGLFYLGLAAALREWLDPALFRFSLTFFLAGGLAFLGWRSIIMTATMRRYLGWALALAAWVVLAAAWAWTAVAEYNARMFIVWLLFITPGVASLLSDDVRRAAFVSGLAVGVSVFGVVAATRVARGLSVFDINPDSPGNYIFSVNRNGVVIRVLFVLPFLMSAKSLPRPFKVLRWPLLVSCVIAVLFSGARSGLIGLLVITLAYVMLQPGSGRRLFAVYAAVLVGLIVLGGIQEFGGQAAASRDRLLEGFSSDKSASNETRRLLLRKEWHLAEEHPVFGVGPGQIRGTYHPVVDEGTTARIRRNVQNQTDHNAYGGLMAEAGFPALALYLLLLAVLVRAGAKFRDSPIVRAATCSFVSILIIQFTGISRLDPLFFFPAAMVMGTVIAHEVALVERPSIDQPQRSRV